MGLLRRAHLHFEVNLILSHDFEQWHNLVFPSEINRHGLYNGINLAGMDAGRLLLAAHKSPGLTIPRVAGQRASGLQGGGAGDGKIRAGEACG